MSLKHFSEGSTKTPKMSYKNQNSSPSSSPPPHSPLRKRVTPLQSTLNFSFDLTHCHSCNLKFKTQSQPQLLKSKYRIQILCSTCLNLIESGDICSYCFAHIDEEEDIFQNCLSCFHKVHYDCIPAHRYYVLPSQVDASNFSCMDCCVDPKPWRKNHAVPDEGKTTS